MVNFNIQFPESLPITQKIEEIRSLLQNHPVIVVCGETGSGKTTQLPKLCLEMDRGKFGKIGHTQPRRIAAKTVALRIAEELKTPLGSIVGYKIRFQDKTSIGTRIKVMTDGILLAETQIDPLLRQYDTLIIDEAHERSLNIDFLFGLIKKILVKRNDLKVIITSATLDPAKFSRFFDNAPLVEVSGRSYPVEVLYRPLLGEQEEEKIIHQMDGILQAVLEVGTLGTGDILIFLSGEREIRETSELLRNHHPPHTEILPLYSRLNAREQHKVFEPHAGRRIILSTNVAETSVTVPNIQFVIDTGLARIRRYNYRSHVERLRIEPISKASCDQRKGRCGRVMAGVCVRLYSESDYVLRSDYTEPEILRSHLSTVILQMLALGLGDIEQFPFLDPPDNRHIREGLKLLEQLGAISENNELTPFGRKLSQLPVDPKLGAMILASQAQSHAQTQMQTQMQTQYQTRSQSQVSQPENALREVLIIVSGLSIQDPRERPLEWQKAADEKHARFKVENSDFLSYLKLWDYIHESKSTLSKNKFKILCQTEFLSFVRIQEWLDVHQQLHKLLLELGYKESQIPASHESIHKALLTGLLSNIGTLAEQKQRNQYLGIKNTKFQVFPGSQLFSKPPKWIMAFELVETEKIYARTAAKILPEWVEQVAARFLKVHYSDPHFEKKIGHVMAYAKATFYGLQVYEGRKVVYGKIDPKLSREIFIREALVLGSYDTPAPFFDYNRHLIESVETLEDKSRRADILVDEDSLFDFYQQKIPEDIYNRDRFEKWIKTKEPDFLKFKLQHLIQDDKTIEDINAYNYPNTIQVLGMEFPLTYHFAPGEVDDGVTVLIPEAALPQLPEDPFEWLIPGSLLEKITLLIKSLPKQYRHYFLPIPVYAKAVQENLSFGQGSLTEEIGQQLKKMSGISIPKEAWNQEALPIHLKMNYKIVDKNGTLLKMERDLIKLKSWVSTKASVTKENQSQKQVPNQKIDSLENWNLGAIPESLEIDQAGIKIIVYPALVDKIDFVIVENQSTKEIAVFRHRQGIRRLLSFCLKKDAKAWLKQITNLNTLALQYSSIGTKDELSEEIWMSAIDNAFLDQNNLESNFSLPKTQEEFKMLLDAGKPKLGIYLQDLSKILGSILPIYIRILNIISTSNRASSRPEGLPRDLAGTSLEQQLDHLIYKGFILDTPYEWLLRIPVYLQALEQRLIKIKLSREKDKMLSAELKPYWDWCVKILDSNKPYLLDPEFIYFRWMLEEFRVSLFAQSLKTKIPVSRKRIEEAWQKVSKDLKLLL